MEIFGKPARLASSQGGGRVVPGIQGYGKSCIFVVLVVEGGSEEAG